MLVPMSSNVAGDQLCRIYLDGQLYEEKTITLR